MPSQSTDPNAQKWVEVQWEEMIAGAEKALAEQQYQAAEATLFSAMELAYKFGESDNRFVYTLDKLAECLWYRGQLDDAENYCKQLIRIHESVLADVDPVNIASFFNNLALLKHAAKSFDEAEKYYKRALKGKEKALGKMHPEVLRIKSNYADLLRQRGRIADAENMSTSTRVVTVRDWQTSTVSREVQTAQTKSFHPTTNKKGNDGERDINERKAVAFSREEAMLLWEGNKALADRYLVEGNLDLCEKIWLLTMRVLEAVADKSVELSYCFDTLAQLSHARHDYEAAIHYCNRAYDLKLKVLGTRNPVVAQCADMLARLYYLISDYAQAEPFARKCLEYYDKMDEGESVEAGCALHNLATLYHVQRKYEEAEPLYKRALDIKKRTFGDDHPETVRLLRSYGHILMATKKQDQLEAANKNAQLITGSWKVMTVADADSLLASE